MKQETKRVALVLEEGSQYSLRLLEAAIRYAEQHPHIQLLQSDFNSGQTPHWLERWLDCDGLLLFVSPSERWLERLLHRGVPAINTCGSWPPEIMPSVAFSGDGLMQIGMDYIVGLGRESVAMLLYSMEDDPGFRLRAEAFVKIATNRGLHAVMFDVGQQRAMERNPPRLTARGQERLCTFLRQLSLPATVWAMDDFLGYAIVETARSLGIVVPDQLAVLGLGDYTVARYCRPQLSSIPQPGELIGFEAMRVLDGMMAGQQPAQRRILIYPPPVVVRDSTRTIVKGDPQMSQLHDFIVEHACRGISMDNVMKLASMSLPTLHRRFRAVYGRTPSEEIRRIKTEKAKYYLRTTTLSITRIAELCGYNQQATFNVFFKRETKMTPSSYRTNVNMTAAQPGNPAA